MDHKVMNFYTTCWFISVLICIILDGSTSSSNMYAIINNLSVITTINIAGLITLPGLNLNFFSGLGRIIIWDYSFYYGGYQWLRDFWLAILTPGLAWGIFQACMWVYASFIKPF